MRRRAFLACVLPMSIAGCSDDDPPTGDEAPDDDRNEVGDSTYRVVVESPESDPGDESVCEFETLSDGPREEFEAAIDGVEFEADDRGEYESASSPALLDTGCYNGYIAYEGEYYWVGVEVEGG